MGFSRIAEMPALVLTGEQRATLVRRTYLLVFASVIVTIIGTAVTITQEALMLSAARHPFITMILAFVPLWMAMKTRNSAPRALGFVFLFNLVMGVAIAPVIYVYSRNEPGIVGQAGILTLSTFGVLTAYTWISRRARWVVSLESVVDRLVSPVRTNAEYHAELSELQGVLQRAIDTLPATQRMAVMLYYLNDLSLKEISYILDCPVGTIKSRLHYGREHLKKHLEAYQAASQLKPTTPTRATT